MKKCPTCEKTYADHLRFCQSDGTQLVEAPEQSTASTPSPWVDPFSTAEPDDPLKTVVAKPAPTGFEQPPAGATEHGSGTSPLGKPESPIPSPFGSAASDQDFSGTIFSGSVGSAGSDSSSQEPPTMVMPSGVTFGTPSDSTGKTSESGWGSSSAPVAGWPASNMGNANPLPPGGTEGSNKTLAVVSLVCGILGVTCCGIVAGIAAIVTGFIARKKATEDPMNFGGSGMAMAGIVMGIISILITILVIILQVFLGAMGSMM